MKQFFLSFLCDLTQNFSQKANEEQEQQLSVEDRRNAYVLLYSTEALKKREYQLLYHGGHYQRPTNGTFQFRLKPANSPDGFGQFLASLPFWAFLRFDLAFLLLI